MRRRSLASLLLLATLTTPGLAQRTIVDQGGGSAFENAVRSAVTGDTLLVRPGVYDCDLVIERGITVVFDSGAGLRASGTRGLDLRIVGVPAGTSVRIFGGGIGSFSLIPALAIGANGGAVLLEGFATNWASDIGARSVAFRKCDLGRLRVHSSFATLQDCGWSAERRSGRSSSP